MNLIYINHYSGSVNQPREWRPYYLSKSLLNEGVNVSVIGASFHHLHRETYDKEKPVVSKDVDGVRFTWLKTPLYKGNGLKRIINMLSFGGQIFKFDPVKHLNLDTPDAIIISSAHPFHILGGIRWARKYNAKLIFEVRDAWPLSLNLLMGLSKLHPLSMLLEVFQFIGLKAADKVIALPGGLKPYFEKKGMASDKFVHVCNGIDPSSDFNATLPIETELNELRSRYKRIVMYTGSIGVPNAMDYCIEAMNLIEDEDIAMVVVGHGTEKERLKKRAQNPNVYFFDPVPKNTIQSLLAYSDICIISWLSLPLYEYGISPNKVFDYMFAGKPVINAVNSKFNITGECDCGLTIEPENTEVMKQAIVELAALSDPELKRKGDNGKNLVLSTYTYKNLAKKVINETLI
jgi:glycosyltransferase involved in cell wall biosynthesis